MMVIPLLKFSSEDNFRMNCLPLCCLCHVFDPGLQRKLWGEFVSPRKTLTELTWSYPGFIISCIRNRVSTS